MNCKCTYTRTLSILYTLLSSTKHFCTDRDLNFLICNKNNKNLKIWNVGVNHLCCEWQTYLHSISYLDRKVLNMRLVYVFLLFLSTRDWGGDIMLKTSASLMSENHNNQLLTSLISLLCWFKPQCIMIYFQRCCTFIETQTSLCIVDAKLQSNLTAKWLTRAIMHFSVTVQTQPIFWQKLFHFDKIICFLVDANF